MSLLKADLKVIPEIRSAVRAVHRRNVRVLYRTAGFARTTMRRGMRRRKKPSQADAFPSAHSGELKELIRFAVDKVRQASDVGPIKFSTPKNWQSANAQTVPELLQEGGTVTERRGKKTIRKQYRKRPFVTLTNVKAARALAENMRKSKLRSGF